MMASITRWVLAHKRRIAAFWIVITLIGMASAGSATKALKQKFSVPGKEAWITNTQIAKSFRGTGGSSAPLVPVVTLPAGQTVDSPGVRGQLAAIDHKLASALPGSRLASFASTGNRAFVSKDGRTTFAVAYPGPDPNEPFNDNPKAAKRATAALRGATVAGAPVHLSGFDALQNQSGGGNGPGVLLEALLGGVGALAVLAFVFASFLAIVPILMAIVSIMTTFLVLWGLTTITDVSPIVQFLVALIGLGGGDRLRAARRGALARGARPRAHGGRGGRARDGDRRPRRRLQRHHGRDRAARAGRAAAALPALGRLRRDADPADLDARRAHAAAGRALEHRPRLDWPHRRTDDKASRAWTRWADAVVRRRWPATVGALLVLGALVAAATSLQPGLPNTDTIAKKGDARDGLVALERSGIGPGALLPHEVLTAGTSPDKVANALAGVSGVHGAVAPAGASWRHGGVALAEAFGTPDGSSSAGRDVLGRVRTVAHDQGPDVRLGGVPAQNDDFISAVYGNFPLMIGLIAVITFILLARAFRSLLLPAKAVILNVVSVGAAWGVLDLVWQRGHGSHLIWGIAATGSVNAWIPLMVFAFLFGLSMDYEVFILSRMREEYDKTGRTDAAVITGIGRTGRLVTSAALILFLAFAALASGPETDVKVMATGLAAGILLDATVIRALLVPAVISLFGRWNWWLPERPARLLRVEPSLPPRVAPGEAS